jgi:DNA-binding transcriptional regulator YdaS (Cro superfamily)
MRPNSPVEKLITLLGGPVKCAAVLGLKSYQSIQQWRSTRVPAEYCPRIEMLTQGAIRCEDLRPDVDWAYLRGTAPVIAPTDSRKDE